MDTIVTPPPGLSFRMCPSVDVISCDYCYHLRALVLAKLASGKLFHIGFFLNAANTWRHGHGCYPSPTLPSGDTPRKANFDRSILYWMGW